MDFGAIIGLVTQLAGSFAGHAMSQMDRNAAMGLIQQSVDAYGRIQLPKLKELILSQQAKTGLSDIKDDPKYRDQQNAADAQLGDIVDSGGLTLSDKAALNAIRNRTARTESAGRNAITNEMAARGSLDSGSQLAAQLHGNQQSANSLGAADEATAGQAQARAFQAIKERAALAGQGLDRSYKEQSDAARAQDAINAGNTAIMNTAARYNAAIPQQNFDNQMSLVNAQNGARNGQAAVIAGRAKDTQDEFNQYGNMAASALKNIKFNNNVGTSLSADSNDYAGRGSASDLSMGQTDDELQGDSTKPLGARTATGTDGRTVIGFDAQGRPIYGQPQGQNF